MKKLFATVLVLAALLAGTAVAGDMHYKVYGLAHVSTEMLNNGDESSIFVSSNNTRLGVKGKYETGSEYFTVVFQYESTADFNGESGNTLSSRNSFAGVMGDWGTVIWGRHDTPMKLLGRKTDFFGDRIGDSRNATAYFGAGWDMRVTDMIMYKSPMLGDAFSLQLQYVPEEGMDDATLFGASAYYELEKFWIGVAFESHGAAWEPAYDDTDPDNVIGESSTGIRAGAMYQADGLSVAGLFQTLSNVGGVEDISSTTFGGGVAYELESGFEPKAQYYLFDPNTDADDDGGSMLVVGVDYHLNDKALLYLTYAMMMNEDAAYTTPFRGGHGQNYTWDGAERFGESPYGLAVGLIAWW